MKNKKTLVIIILLLLATMSIGTYVYVQREFSAGVNEKAEASEVRQSDLEVLERQLNPGNLDSNEPSIDLIENQENSVEDNENTGIGSGGLSSPTSSQDSAIITDPSVAPEGFQNRRSGEISNEAAQTTVNLTVTNPNNVTQEDE